MAISWDDFDKIWASTSPLTPYLFSDNNYKQGWNFVGATPPARQMWDSIQKANDEKFKFLRDNFGTPNIVTTASQMTDTSKVYVYMGSEAGWSNGHWYYYNGTAWADGGVYNSVAFMTDSTLTLQGQPADAKAVGDALALKADLAGATFTGDIAINADLSTTGTVTVGTDLSVAGDSTLENITTNGDVTVAGASTLASLFVEGTTALAGTSTAVTPNADDNSTNIATTEYVQTEIKPIEANASFNDKLISNIEKLLQVNLYDYKTDSTIAYTKTVPAGAMPYAGLEKLGGKTVVWNQLVQYTAGTYTNKGITFTMNNDGSINVSGTATENAYANIGATFPIPTNHKYLVRGCPAGGSISTYYLRDGYVEQTRGVDTGNGYIFDKSSWGSTTDTCIPQIVVLGGTTVDLVFKPQFIDLTLMYGAGNEPSTVEQLREMFPADYYEYNSGELLSAGVTEVVSKYKTVVWNQTYTSDIARDDLTNYGITLQKTETSIRIYGAFTSRVNVPLLNSWYPILGHIYLVTGTPLGDVLNIRVWQNGAYVTWQENKPFTANSERTYVGVVAKEGKLNVEFDITWTPQIFDLTLMFGAGNEPSTYEEFRQMFPASYYPYNAGTEIPLSVAIKDGVDVALQTPIVLRDYPIPAEVQALDGYGWSAGILYNYIDFERKVFVKQVGEVVLNGTENWYQSVVGAGVENYVRGYTVIADMLPTTDTTINDDTMITTSELLPSCNAETHSGQGDGIHRRSNGVKGLLIGLAGGTDIDFIKTHLANKPLTVHYPLETPIETDISQYLTDNLIEVEASGTLAFPNSNGDNYRIPVPSTEEYMINLQEAVSNG